jgi:hypothetical protein
MNDRPRIFALRCEIPRCAKPSHWITTSTEEEVCAKRNKQGRNDYGKDYIGKNAGRMDGRVIE